jgi:hypothetical protein
MSIAVHIRSALELPDFVVRSYLEDLSDADLLVRPLATMNHIAWQLGHLIASENGHIEHVAPGAMPPLPAGFAQRHARQSAASDDPADFLSKAEYLEQMRQQRAGTLAALEQFSDEQLAAPAPESIRYLGPTVGCVFAGESAHWMMHAGQWAVVRRRLGRPPLF